MTEPPQRAAAGVPPGCDPRRVVVGTSPYVVSHAPALVTAQSQGAGVSAAGLDSIRAEVRARSGSYLR